MGIVVVTVLVCLVSDMRFGTNEDIQQLVKRLNQGQ